MLKELLDVRHIGRGFHEVIQRRTGSLQRGLDILAHLAHLRPHIPFADDVPLPITGELARNEDEASSLRRHNMGIAHMAAHHPLRQGLRLNVLALHGSSPSHSGSLPEGSTTSYRVRVFYSRTPSESAEFFLDPRHWPQLRLEYT